MVEHSVWDLYWSHPGLVVRFVSFASVCLPCSATLFPVGVLNVNLGVWWCKFESLPHRVDSGISKSWPTQQCILLAESVGETHGVNC